MLQVKNLNVSLTPFSLDFLASAVEKGCRIICINGLQCVLPFTAMDETLSTPNLTCATYPVLFECQRLVSIHIMVSLIYFKLHS